MKRETRELLEELAAGYKRANELNENARSEAEVKLAQLREDVETFMGAFHNMTPRSSQTVSAMLHRDLDVWVQRDLRRALDRAEEDES